MPFEATSSLLVRSVTLRVKGLSSRYNAQLNLVSASYPDLGASVSCMYVWMYGAIIVCICKNLSKVLCTCCVRYLNRCILTHNGYVTWDALTGIVTVHRKTVPKGGTYARQCDVMRTRIINNNHNSTRGQCYFLIPFQSVLCYNATAFQHTFSDSRFPTD